jgi:hypothetical protein
MYNTFRAQCNAKQVADFMVKPLYTKTCVPQIFLYGTFKCRQMQKDYPCVLILRFVLYMFFWQPNLN